MKHKVYLTAYRKSNFLAVPWPYSQTVEKIMVKCYETFKYSVAKNGKTTNLNNPSLIPIV